MREILDLFDRSYLGLELIKNSRCLKKLMSQATKKTWIRFASSWTTQRQPFLFESCSLKDADINKAAFAINSTRVMFPSSFSRMIYQKKSVFSESGLSRNSEIFAEVEGNGKTHLPTLSVLIDGPSFLKVRNMPSWAFEASSKFRQVCVCIVLRQQRQDSRPYWTPKSCKHLHSNSINRLILLGFW